MDRPARSPVRNTQPPHVEEWIGATMEARGRALQDLLELADALPQGLRPEGAPRLPAKVLAVERALAGSGVPHAFGGAIALAYYGEPRTTLDMDVNVFLAVDRRLDVIGALPPPMTEIEVDEEAVCRAHEIRLPWDRNDLHLFFSTDALHEGMPAAIREVPLAETTIPIVSPEHLIVRKAMLDRPKDWLDIEAILITTTPLDLDEVRRWLGLLTGPADPRLSKFEAVIARA
jgi:hypothetical protein